MIPDYQLIKHQIMSGLKNLIPKGIFADNHYATLKKKSEDFKKSINTFVQHLQQINNIYQNYYGIFQKNISQLVSYFSNDQEANRKFFKEVIAIFKSLNKELRNFIEKESNNQKSILHVSQLFMVDYNMLVEIFQEKCKEYSLKQQNLVESCQEYFKTYKQMLNNIENYKNSFMDVKIIYNKDEKIKRYNECVATYKNLEEDLAIIYKKVQQLNKHKDILVDKYQILEKQLTNFTSSFASRYIDELKKFTECLFEMENNKLHLMSDRLQSIDNLVTENFFISTINLRYQQLISRDVKLSDCEFLPCFIYYSDAIKEEARPLFKKMVIIYYQQISIKIQKRKILDKKIIEYMYRYLKALDKTLMDSYRQTLLNFEKMRKKIGEVFGNRWISFYKIVSSLFQNSIENTGRLMKRVQGKTKIIESSIAEQVMIFDSFLRQFKNYIDRAISKKIFKKYTQGFQQKSQTLLQQQTSTTTEEITEISNALKRQIGKVNENILKSDSNLKLLYVSFLSDIKASMSEFHSFCGEIQQNYYKEDIYSKNYQLCTDEIALSVKKQMKFFQEMPFYALKQSSKITFDGQFNKIQGFKKIKKPKELEQILKQNNRGLSQQGFFQGNNRETDLVSISNTNNESGKMLKQMQKECFIGDNTSKYAQFLSKRIEFENNQKYVKSCSCALSDKIILAGRLFVTTHRLFFYSKFNRNNIFFGETFIEVPKKDIKKIEKKYSSLFINNAISITTINGQLFFTSILSRDKIFNILKNTFEVNSEELFFEQQEMQDEQKQELLEFEDDMKVETSLQREKEIMKQINQFDYIQVHSSEFQLYGLNPVKFLKIFDLDQQLTINRTLYPSFTYYLKDKAENKDINIQSWSPNPMDYLNTINIKQLTPLSFTRKIESIVPLPNSNIPFMPKTSFTTESQKLYIINKDKYIMEVIVKNSGVPYCDAFDIRIKKIIQSSGQSIFYVNIDKVKMTVAIFLNFNQNVMVKSTIQSKTLQTSKQNFDSFGNEIKAYLKILEKKLTKNSKKETPQDKILEQAQTIEQQQKQIQILKREKKEIINTIQLQKIRIRNIQIAAVVLLLIVVFQLHLLIF